MNNIKKVFTHTVNGNVYKSTDVHPPFSGTLKDYKALCKRVYGDLRGIKFAEYQYDQGELK